MGLLRFLQHSDVIKRNDKKKQGEDIIKNQDKNRFGSSYLFLFFVGVFVEVVHHLSDAGDVHGVAHAHGLPDPAREGSGSVDVATVARLPAGSIAAEHGGGRGRGHHVVLVNEEPAPASFDRLSGSPYVIWIERIQV